MHKISSLALAVSLLAANAHAVILQVDLSGSTDFAAYADYTDSDDTFYSTQDIATLTNGSSPLEASVAYNFGGSTGESTWSTNIGTGDSFYIDLDTNEIYPVDGSASGNLTTSITVEIVAENGESDGTQVTLDWSTAVLGNLFGGGYATTDISIDSTSIFSVSETSSSSDAEVQGFSQSDSGQITTYSIGDTFSLDVTVVAASDDEIGAEAIYLTSNLLTMTATAVPEPGSLSLLGLGAFALLRRRRNG